MFILSKDVIKDIVKYGEKWQEYVKNEDLLSALATFFLAPIFILLIISFFILDIIFFPLETIIYLKVRKVRKEKSAKEFQPTYKLNRKDSRKFKEWECMYERNK